MTVDDLVAEITAEIRAADTAPREVVKRTGPSERFRAAMQGVTFGGADEAEAFLRSQFTDEEYDAALSDIRGNLAEYRQARPIEALGFEAGGALLPSIALGLVSGGGGTVTQMPRLEKLGRVLGAGAAEGSAYAFLTGEGGAVNRAARMPGGAVMGAAGAGVGAAVGAGGGYALRQITDAARRKLGTRASGAVEREIRKAAQDAGLSLQETIDGVVNGRILADNKTIQTTIRAWMAQSAEADAIIRKGVSGRPDATRSQMMDYLQSTMGAEGNALKGFKASDDALAAAKSADYNRIYDAAPNVLDDTATGELVDAFRRVPAAANDLDKLLKAETGKKPFFRVVDGEIEFDRNPTLREAEIMRRSIKGATDREFKTGSGEVAKAYKNVEGPVRQRIDEISPELKAVRAEWSALERAREAFKAGQKALSNPDQAQIDFEAIIDMDDQTVLKAYRAGLVDSYRRKAQRGTRKSLPKNLADDQTAEGMVLRMAFPEDNLPEMERLAGNAAAAQETSNKLLGQSPTAITQGRLAEQGISLAEGALDASTGSPAALLRIAGQAVKSMQPGLSPKQAAEAAKLMVETDPSVVARALTDTTGVDALYNLANRVMRRGSTIGTYAGGATGGFLGSLVQ